MTSTISSEYVTHDTATTEKEFNKEKSAKFQVRRPRIFWDAIAMLIMFMDGT